MKQIQLPTVHCDTLVRANREQAAFTLIELLIVIAVLAVLMAVLLPTLAGARRSAAAVVCGSNLRQISLAFDMYLGDHRDVYPAAEDPVSESPFYWLWMGRGFRGFVGPYLVDDIDAENPSVLVCPADPTDADVFERTSYAYSMAFYHSPEQIDAMSNPADTYSNPQPAIGQQIGDVPHPAAKILCGEWSSNHAPLDEDRGWWDTRGSRMFLFADGHVKSHAAPEVEPARDQLPDANLTKGGVRGFDVR
jgi:prepilin-type N-terminal cleavage/methylation domain-containing protein/prepilin-type processing-associated H-X9-DG protein